MATVEKKSLLSVEKRSGRSMVNRLRNSSEQLRLATARRDEIVRAALKAGLPRTAIMEATGLDKKEIERITSEH